MQKCSACHRRTLVAIGSVLLFGFADQPGQTTGCRLADECLPASGWAIEKKTLRLRKLEPFERLCVQQRILDRLSDTGDRLVLSTDLLPCDLGRDIKDMTMCLAIRELLDRHSIAWIDANFIARLELHADKIRRSLQDQRLSPHLLFKPQSPIRHGLGQ